MVTVTTVVEIAAPPSLVRSLFLNFSTLSQYHTGHFQSIKIIDPHVIGTTSAEDLPLGSKLHVTAGGMSFGATVLENTPKKFSWKGGLSYVVVGEHSFVFENSATIPGGTSLLHGETFTGGLVAMCKLFMKSDDQHTSPGFERFNQDLKRWAEAKAREKL